MRVAIGKWQQDIVLKGMIRRFTPIDADCQQIIRVYLRSFVDKNNCSVSKNTGLLTKREIGIQ